MNSLVDWAKARPRLRPVLTPLIMARRLVQRPGLERRLRQRAEMYSRIVEGSAVFRLPEFRGAYEIDIRSDLAERIMFYGTYEPDLASLCELMVDPEKDAIDVGANVGLYTGLLAHHLTAGRRVLCLEPTPRAHQLLVRNLERNGLQDRVLPLEMVASDREGQHEMNVCVGREEYSSCGRVVHPSARGTTIERHVVPGTTIDAACQQYGLEPAFMKIDVEGYEFHALRGAERTIRGFRPIILAEVSDSMLRACGASSGELLSWLGEMDYRATDATRPDKEASGDFDGEVLALPS